ncbi:MAG: GGDEF domain-containing protein [Deltaproteobacteria bacterium]|nr:GGDEF domain-containing protein [Deltaproteobacteria bacterium]
MARLTRSLVVQLAILALGWIPVAWPSLLGTDDPFVARAFRVAPLAGLLLLGVLGLRINQSKVAIGSAAFAVAFLLVDGRTLFGLPEGHARERELAIAVSLPLIIGILGQLPEQRVLSVQTAVRGFVCVLLPAFATRLAIHGVSGDTTLTPFFDWLHLPELAALPLLGLVLVTAIQSDPHVRAFQAGQATSLLVMLFGFERSLAGGSVDTIAVAFTVGVAIQIAAMLGVWWRKVYIDELTEVPNRRALNEYLRTLGERFAIAMVDIDFFKKFNDTYGHAEGDNVLRYVARHLADNASGRVFRYGGEEFCLVYRGRRAEEVFETVDTMRDGLAKRTFVVRAPAKSKLPQKRRTSTKKDRGRPAGNKTQLSVTISVGLASKKGQKNVDAVMEAADMLLYRAKDQGRNQVVAG